MLSESFIAASSAPPTTTSSNHALLKDAGLFQHAYQPEPGLRKTFKNTKCEPNCLTISSTHIFTAQKDKAIVHVYSREKESLEAVIPFPERIQSLDITQDGTILALGSEGGRILLWELCTGRFIASPAAHVQSVTVVAIDEAGDYLLSGSADSNVHVWSLDELLAFPSEEDRATDRSIQPRHTLSTQTGGVTAIAISQSRATSSNYAAVGAKDSSVTIWDYCSGELLRTILVSATPTSLALDPADRAIYVGLADGSIQLIDFFRLTGSSSIFSPSTTPLQCPPADLMPPPPNSQPDVTHALTLSYDATILLSAHESGDIFSWDISSRSFLSTVASYPGTSITNIIALPPTGWPNKMLPRLKSISVVKPKPHEDFSSSIGRPTGSYSLHAHFPDNLSHNELDPWRRQLDDKLTLEMSEPSFSSSLIAESAFELFCWDPKQSMGNAEKAEDFVSLSSSEVVQTPQQKIDALQKQVEHLKNMQRISAKQIERLTHEKAALKKTSET